MTGDLAARFTDPRDFGPVPIWWWSGAPLEPARLRWQMEQLIAGGIREAVVLNLAPSGPLYGSLADSPEFFTDPWWDIFTGVCADAQELGFRIWFYDQLGFSGADIQGRVLRQQPAYQGCALDRLVAQVGGPSVLEPPEGATALAGFAVTEGVEKIDVSGGCLHWEGGPARLVLTYASPRGFDYLSADACTALRDAVHGEFDRRVGHLFGSVIAGSFQDELPSMPTWSQDFPAEFAKRRGYPIEDLLLHLWEELDDGTAQIRVDYQRTRAELAEEAFFAPMHAWHEQRGLLAGCDQQHPARAGYPLEATQQYADYLRTHRWFTAPGSDHWGEATIHSSLAHLYDRPRTWVEAFHSTGWGGTLEETLDWLMPWLRAGANLYDPHAVYYATPGGAWEWAPPSTCWRQPYWRHHRVFADTVARLCAALTWGDHVCEIGVLFPTAAAAAELEVNRPEILLGSETGTSQAQDLYLDIVGRMHWFEPVPGVLDRHGWDLDVLDDDSVVRGVPHEGRLVIGRESYGAVVLPGCAVVEPETLEALTAFALDGGTVVIVGDGPNIVGARRCATAMDLPAALQHLPRRIESAAPTLLRANGSDGVLLVLSGAATEQPKGRRWREEGISFDPGRRVSSTEVSVTGLAEPVALWDPVSATAQQLPTRREGDRLVVEVPFSSVPCALLVFGSQALNVPLSRPPHPAGSAVALQGWTAKVLPTLDDAWGDSGLPMAPGPVQVWNLEHEVEGAWRPVRVTFGRFGKAVGPGLAGDLPPVGSCPDDRWWDVVWSPLRGPSGVGDPKGFVPEEFLDLGDVAAGQAVHVRLVVNGMPAGQVASHLLVGSAARVDGWWNRTPLALDQPLYYARGTVSAATGEDLLELRFTARADGPLRASLSVTPGPTATRPEWVTGMARIDGGPCPGGLVQFGTIGRVTLEVDGVEVARHGETDNYTHVAQPRVRRYVLPAGDRVSLLLHEPTAAAVLDGVVVTNGTWASAGVTGLAALPHDPRWVQLLDYQHPLTRALGVVAGSGRPERFRFTLPPGAQAIRLPAGAVAVVEDRTVEQVGDEHCFAAVDAGTPCVVTLPASRTRQGGALWDGPVVVTRCGEGSITLGDWQELGLHDYSGGVRYRTVATGHAGSPAADLLDLGIVRGTAEVTIDGTSVGVRAWSPYTFDIRGLLRAGSVIEIDVFNTLAPHQRAVSATPWVLPGQSVSGLFGPVTIHHHASTEGVS